MPATPLSTPENGCRDSFLVREYAKPRNEKFHKLVDHKLVEKQFFSVYSRIIQDNMEKPFAYGVSVSGENFTDRKKETRQLLMDFTHGVNVILISPRRMGKTSLVKRVIGEIEDSSVIPVFLDIYDCRDEYDFYNRFSEAILKGTSSSLDSALKDIAEFIGRISPRISMSPDIVGEYSFSLGLSPKQVKPEEILDLPERIARKKGKHLLICIDEFQQVGEFPDSVAIQKRMRGVWQHQENVSYCLFGSSKHMLENIFQNKRMPFYQFGQVLFLDKIATGDWVEYIVSRFRKGRKEISEELARRICATVNNHSSYVQQLAWNLYAETDRVATEDGLKSATDALMAQNDSFFTEQIKSLSSYQVNFLKAVCAGVHTGFTSKAVLTNWNIGTKSNIAVLKKTLLNKELIEERGKEIHISDAVFEHWMKARFGVNS